MIPERNIDEAHIRVKNGKPLPWKEALEKNRLLEIYKGLAIRRPRPRFVFEGKDRFWYQVHRPDKKTISVFYMGAKGRGRYQFPVIMGGSPGTYYVKNGGNDGADGLSDANAWETIGKVQGFGLSAADIVYFNRGDSWTEDWTPQEGGASGDLITYGAYGSGAKPIITYSDATPGAPVIWLSGVSYLRFENLDVKTAVDGVNYVISTSAASACVGLEFIDCDFYGGDQCVSVGAATSRLIMTGGIIESCGQDGVLSMGPNNIFENITITDWGRVANDRAGIKLYEVACINNIVRNCTAHSPSANNDYLVGLESDLGRDGHNALYEFNEVYSCPIGIQIFESSDTVVRQNIIHDLDDRGQSNESGIIVNSNSDDCFVYNNAIHNWYYCLEIGDAARCTVKNNIFSEGSGEIVAVYGDDHTTHALDHNVHHNAGASSWQWGASSYTWAGFLAVSGQEARGLNADPLFIDADGDDYALQAASPCIDAGIDVGLPEDIIGTPIPQGTAPDIGAYEYRGDLMSVITDLQAIEADLRQKAAELIVYADQIAQSIIDLRTADDALDAAADVIELD